MSRRRSLIRVSRQPSSRQVCRALHVSRSILHHPNYIKRCSQCALSPSWYAPPGSIMTRKSVLENSLDSFSWMREVEILLYRYILRDILPTNIIEMESRKFGLRLRLRAYWYSANGFSNLAVFSRFQRYEVKETGTRISIDALHSARTRGVACALNTLISRREPHRERGGVLNGDAFCESIQWYARLLDCGLTFAFDWEKKGLRARAHTWRYM